MDKFCMKCGRELNPDTGSCPVCSNASNDENNNQQTNKSKKKSSRVIKKVIAVAVVIGIIIASISVTLVLKKDKNLSVEALSDSNYISLSEGFTDVVVKDETSALEAINSVAEQLGIINAKEELKTININTVDGTTYYRFQQYYNDIPVYGRNVVLAADTSGIATILTSNFTPVNIDEINVESFDNKKASKAIIDYFKETENIDVAKVFLPEVSKDNAMIYNLSNYYNEACVAYIFNITILSNGKTDFYEIAYNPKKDVVAISPVFRDAGKIATVYSEDAKISAEGWMINENSYQLFNDEYNISVFDFNNNTVSSENGIEADLSTYGYSIMSSNNNKFSTQGVFALKNIISCSEYFNILGDNGFDSIHVAINDSYDSGNNARGGSTVEDGESKAILLIGTNTGASDVDVCGHEYTHAVSRDIVHWAGASKETGAINEGISDIFGELIEYYCLDIDEPDWCMKGDNIEVVRNLANPSDNGYPKSINDTLDNNSDYSHGYSTLISHAAYLMWNGIDGAEEQKIGTELLANLWYQAMHMFQPDVTFNQCAGIVSMIAKQMNDNKILSDDQYNCVKVAFEKVGLTSKIFQSGNEMTVYDQNIAAYNNYHLTIKNLFSQKIVVDKVIDTYEAYILNFDIGSYIITIKDNAENGSSSVYTETITIVPNLREKRNLKKLEIFTDFGSASDESSVTKETLVSATDLDFEQLCDLLNVLQCEFDYTSSTAMDEAAMILLGDLGLYGEYFDDAELVEENDPQGCFNKPYYLRYPEENVDWVLRNVFNINPIHNWKSNSKGFVWAYYENGYYYVNEDGYGLIRGNMYIENYVENSTGEYYITLKTEEQPEYGESQTFYISAALKEIDGERIWSLYKISLSAFGDTGISEEELYYEYVEKNCKLLCVYGGENVSSAIFSAVISDLDGDSMKEMVAFEWEETEGVVLNLYEIVDNKVVLSDSSEVIKVSGAGNFECRMCGVLEGTSIKIQKTSMSSGGSCCNEEFFAFEVNGGQLVLKENYSSYENAGANNIFKYEELVSGKTFDTYEDLINAVENVGYDVEEHYHTGFVYGQDAENTDFFDGNHIFGIVNLRDGVYDDTYISDNTDLIENVG